MIVGLMQVAAALGALVTLWLAVDFWRDPEGGMRRATHRPEMLPRVMVGRYAAFTVLALAAALRGDPATILVLFAVFAAVSLFDARLYARAGLPFLPHALAAGGCLIVIVLASVALDSG
jgi:hypothetical protein